MMAHSPLSPDAASLRGLPPSQLRRQERRHLERSGSVAWAARSLARHVRDSRADPGGLQALGG